MPTAKPSSVSSKQPLSRAVKTPPVPAVLNEANPARLLRLIKIEAIVIAGLSALIVLAVPFTQPLYQYYARNPKNEVMQLVPLTVPNMTNQAVLSWATTGVTEIMTIGFGDYKDRLTAQKSRFTSEGWNSFVDAFDRQKIGESFKKNQLVLTTVPSDTPVIVGQGVNSKHIYEWHVQMPVIMTYATNDNISQREKAVIQLTIVRVQANQNPSGIGITNWQLKI